MKKIILMLLPVVLALIFCSCDYKLYKTINVEQKEYCEELKEKETLEEVPEKEKTPNDIFCEEQDKEWERDKAQAKIFSRRGKTPIDIFCEEQDEEWQTYKAERKGY